MQAKKNTVEIDFSSWCFAWTQYFDNLVQNAQQSEWLKIWMSSNTAIPKSARLNLLSLFLGLWQDCSKQMFNTSGRIAYAFLGIGGVATHLINPRQRWRYRLPSSWSNGLCVREITKLLISFWNNILIYFVLAFFLTGNQSVLTE